MKITRAKDGNLVYDVGLHRGEDADFYLKKGFRVVAFEANPEMVELCTLRLKSYIDRGQLIILQGAIVDPAEIRAGRRKVEFYRNTVSAGWGTIRTDWADRNLKGGASSTVTEVDVIDFGAALEAHGIPHYMKIDIEGCDLICVKTLEDFQERPNYISIESDKTSFSKIREEIDQLSAVGFQSFKTVEQSAIEGANAPSPGREGLDIEHTFESGSSGAFGAELKGKWLSKREVLRRYRFIRLGYYLLGDDGILNTSRFRGASRLRSLARRLLGSVTHDAVPGWYDTHARLLPAK